MSVSTTRAVLAAVISAGLACSATTQGTEQPGEKVDVKSLPTSVQQTINQHAAGGEIVQVKREDDTNGKRNYFFVICPATDRRRAAVTSIFAEPGTSV